MEMDDIQSQHLESGETNMKKIKPSGNLSTHSLTILGNIDSVGNITKEEEEETTFPTKCPPCVCC